MTPTTTPERKARCRMLDARDNRCENPVIDDDPTAPQFCPRHALEGAQLLQDAGAIRIQYAPFTARRTS